MLRILLAASPLILLLASFLIPWTWSSEKRGTFAFMQDDMAALRVGGGDVLSHTAKVGHSTGEEKAVISDSTWTLADVERCKMVLVDRGWVKDKERPDRLCKEYATAIFHNNMAVINGKNGHLVELFYGKDRDADSCGIADGKVE